MLLLDLIASELKQESIRKMSGDMEGMPVPVRLKAADGYELSATKYPAKEPVRGHIVVAGATGVPQGFYRRFAVHACDQGFTVLTLDYRGIGQSRPATLKGFEASFLDWGQLDLAAAVDAMSSEVVPLFMVGHSFGGHAFGLLPNHDRVSGFYVFGTGAGWHGWMPWPERWRVWLLWNVVLPPLVHWQGYMPWQKFGMGENLPLPVYRQWRHWCKFPHYFFDDPAMAGIADRYALVNTPIVAANALDDSWATPSSRDAFVSAYRNAPLQKRDIDPRGGFGKIGHMGYFRQKATPLWDELLDWFEHLQATQRLRV
jgi:predicted alpha/beta hydrolase